MKKQLLLGLVLTLLTAGCATQGFVREQTDPIHRRLNDLNSKLAEIENRLSQMPTMSEMVNANKAVLEKAGEMNKDNAAKAEVAANRADAAAKTAETAAGEAKLSAEKAEKALELGQKK